LLRLCQCGTDIAEVFGIKKCFHCVS
jgi:hypothetical protein